MTSKNTNSNKSMRSSNEFSPYLEAGLKAIRKAEDLIRRYYFHPQIVHMKSDMAPVTMADKEAEKVMREFLSEKFPEHGFLGEELKATESQDGFYWIIDPIDGTNNYI
ncbi:MAG TPA: inositol monophosphatase family protein, partial [candidate division Zixibacteria bacterium]|nr:inositol monophosphatase family protein [candidate division Zixibacteria bacterium]